MVGSDGSRSPDRPSAMLRPRQSAIRLRRPSATSRTSSRPTAPTVGSGETAEHLPAGPSRSASISVPGTFGNGGSAAARTGRSHRVREPSALTPVLPEEPQENQVDGEDSHPSRADDEKSGKPGILSRLRWNSDTNLHATSQPDETISENPNQRPTDQHEYDDRIVNLLDAIGESPPNEVYGCLPLMLTALFRSRS